MHSPSGYVDLQVNGYADVDFNADDLSLERVVAVCKRLKEEGVAGIAATVITADIESMRHRLQNIVRVRAADKSIAQMIWGIHIEGPFLNPELGYIGAHPKQHAQPADPDVMLRLLEAADGLTRIVTLAPECDPVGRVTNLLAKQSVIVAAGHCNPTLDQLRTGIDAGVSMFTHLGNGCPALLPRHENIVQRVLSQAEHLHIGFIADGVHVPFVALANYLKCCGIERAFVVTDAICGAGLGPGEYTLGDRAVVVDENFATWSADRSHLVGSAGTMRRSEENLRNALGLTQQQTDDLLKNNPLRIFLAN